MVVLFQQNVENRDFFSNFSINGLHSQDILLIIPLEFQGKKHGSVIVRGCFISQNGENAAFLSIFPLGGRYGWDILLVILFELQGKRHQPFSMIQPFSMLLRQNNHILWQSQIFIENVNVSASRQRGLSRGSLAMMPPSLSALLLQVIQTCQFRFAPSEATG